MTGKIVTLFIPILHQEDYTSSKYSQLPRINSIWVKRVPSGNVTVVSASSAPSEISEVYNQMLLPPSAFIAGQTYFINLKSISYSSGADQADPPLVAFV